MEKNLKIKKALNPHKRSRHWQLFFVDDHGNMISFPWLKKLAIVIMTALIVFMFCTFMLFVLYHNNQQENIRLKEKLDESGQKVKNIRHEMDMLLAKLVLAESKMGTDQEEAPPEESQNMPGEAVKPAVASTENVQSNQAADQDDADQSAKKAILGITKFKISQEPGSPGLLKISFVIRNIDQSVKTASGYIFIILKPDEKDTGTWFSVPPTDLQNGYPMHIKQGQFFRISRFKTVYFRARNQIAPDQLKSASVFVFDSKGERIFEKSFPIERHLVEQN